MNGHLRDNPDSIGGIVEAIIHGCPAGLGDPVFDKLNARLSYALMSIGTLRGVEFGLGFEATKMTGSKHNDKFFMECTSERIARLLEAFEEDSEVYMRVSKTPATEVKLICGEVGKCTLHKLNLLKKGV